MKGKLETTYCWTCATCSLENKRLDDQHCAFCGKERDNEAVLRHFRLTPEPLKVGFRT